MSWDIELHDADGNVLTTKERFQEGGTQAVGGTNECCLNVTYNYSELYDFRERLDGKTVAETRGEIEAFLAQHGGKRPYRDYWAPTLGNVAAVMRRLKVWMDEHPQGRWRVR